ncbi:MAG: DEAD/DEAH box helicase family protein [Alphaproteobacteria bacterium]|nr:DEAD/DEAH box helicase family protein [Alphaproteobacteria bacterium]
MAINFTEKPADRPTLYAYSDTNPQYQGLLKVGFTTRGAAVRVAQQYPTKRPGKLPYRIELEEPALSKSGALITDHDIHRWLREQNIPNPEGEWFQCNDEMVRSAIYAVRDNYMQNATDNPEIIRSQNFALRPEQLQAVNRTADYFKSYHQDNPNDPPRFLWNAKMRFGKTFTTYKLAQKLAWKKLLVVTFKPAVKSAWRDDLNGHVDFAGWQFLTRDSPDSLRQDPNRPIVYFCSLQDLLGQGNYDVKRHNRWIHDTRWDGVVFDEYHYGAWREKTKDLFPENESDEDAPEKLYGIYEDPYTDRSQLTDISADHYLYLSGTPFRAISNGEFIEEQIFNWTYSDEQRAKAEWKGDKNPYLALPQMIMMTYELPEELRRIAIGGEYNEFELNEFFRAEFIGKKASFVHQEEVQKWLNLIRGGLAETNIDMLRLGATKPALPYSDHRLLALLNHSFWFLPNVAACHAMQNLLAAKNNVFYHDYRVVVAAGKEAGIGAEALRPVENVMKDPLESKSITLSCGKLTTGVTVKPWSAIFMLRNCQSPETYFQAAFRVQSPWTIKNPDGDDPNREVILKPQAFVFDFAPNRALRHVADYSCQLNYQDTSRPEEKVAEFINFLPILAYDGNAMREVNAQNILDLVTSGTSATLLAKKWESVLLVNVDNHSLGRLMANAEAMAALGKIEGFRNLNEDIQTIINQTKEIKRLKQKELFEPLDKPEKKQLSDAEKEYKSKRKMIQEKLMKLATRIPVFMYLTDFRENSLRDVIEQLEPELFLRVTGLTQKDFHLLVELAVFNSSLMNDAVYKFKRYEDASLNYIDTGRADPTHIGVWDTVLTQSDHAYVR